MGFIERVKNFISGILRNRQEDAYEFKRSKLDMSDSEVRNEYITGCLDSILKFSEANQTLESDYNKITDLLCDMDELEDQPKEEKEVIATMVRTILALEAETDQYRQRRRLLDEAEYLRISQVAEDIEEGINKLKAEEEYSELIKRDLKRIKAEKDAFRFRQEEAKKLRESLKVVALIILGAFALCMILLFILSGTLGYDIRFGVFCAVVVSAISETAVFFKFENTVREIKRLDASMAKIVALQNTVKIRYVNNKNLLDYLYIKYNTRSYKELSSLYLKYQEEREERTQFAENSAKIEYYRRNLQSELSGLKLNSPLRWITREKALIDEEEMNELRNDALSRRSLIRAQMEENRKTADEAKKEIMKIASDYPEYAGEIMDRISEYEEKTAAKQEA